MKEDGGPQTPSRRNGLQRPFDPLQVVSWGLFTMFIVLFYMFAAPMLRNPVNWCCGISYGVLSIASIVLNFLAARSDASDPGIHNKLDDATLCNGHRGPTQSTCYLCRAFVHKSSKHCRKCNKCVLGFDHHCKWLNNCIGMLRNWCLAFVPLVGVLPTRCIGVKVGSYVRCVAPHVTMSYGD